MDIDLLPLGSVVRMSGGDSSLMVAGYYPESDGRSFDYLGVPYPEGVVEIPGFYLFNYDDIEECRHTGYLDEDGRDVLHAARRIVELRSKMNREIAGIVGDYVLEHPDEFEEVLSDNALYGW